MGSSVSTPLLDLLLQEVDLPKAEEAKRGERRRGGRGREN